MVILVRYCGCVVLDPGAVFKPFVTNRVGEIQSLSDPEQWRHVPTMQNPTDLLTRGLSVCTLNGNEGWWKGPAFLMQEETEWPQTKLEPKRKPT